MPFVPVEHSNPTGAAMWRRWTQGGRRRTGEGRKRDAASRGRDRLCYNAGKASPRMSFFYFRRNMVNRPVISQTSNIVDVSRSLDAQAPLLRVYTFGAFHLDWQVSPFTTEEVWNSRTSARSLFKP